MFKFLHKSKTKEAQAAPMWIIAFLGNPGQKYEQTRHNAGWFAADAVEDVLGIRRIQRIDFSALTDRATIGGETVLLMKPQTYMNNSGEAVGEAARFYKIQPEHVIVVHDDLDLPPGKLRIKRGGSDGGHNGIKSITEYLGTSEYPRVKIGVGRPPSSDFDVVDWVIGDASDADLAAIREAAQQVPAVLEAIIRDGCDTAMNAYN